MHCAAGRLCTLESIQWPCLASRKHMPHLLHWQNAAFRLLVQTAWGGSYSSYFWSDTHCSAHRSATGTVSAITVTVMIIIIRS